MKTLPGIPKVIEEMPFPENDQQIVTHETAPPDITLEIVSPKLYTAKLICILKIVLLRCLSQLVPSKMYWTTFCAEKNLLVLPKLLKITLNIINLIHCIYLLSYLKF